LKAPGMKLETNIIVGNNCFVYSLNTLVAMHHSKLSSITTEYEVKINSGTVAPAIMKYLREHPCHVIPQSLLKSDQNAEKWSKQVEFYLALALIFLKDICNFFSSVGLKLIADILFQRVVPLS
jgi:hypothetical protein